MKTFQFSCCSAIESPNDPQYDGEIFVIYGLVTPSVTAENRGEALSLLNNWFIENKCRPFREVT